MCISNRSMTRKYAGKKSRVIFKIITNLKICNNHKNNLMNPQSLINPRSIAKIGSYDLTLKVVLT